MNAWTLETLRPTLVRLLTALLDAERMEYEKLRGRLPAGAWLAIVLDDQSLAWLRPLSKLIAQTDHAMAEAVRNETPLTEAEVQTLIDEARAFLVPGPRYLELLQRHPGVVLAHGFAVRALPAPPGGPAKALPGPVAP